ncbi:hypothetical protein [Nostoc sp. 'Peltigera malacea cyanobiont' DB3992]|uniref:hypothetical protein n=2 Tax=unclassified Nostoc TaxID=2593658 RepID=UPI000C040C28|nr:hypothetical protein [Nostoc sp. 'Peltigera malacea cyanobiont' DB3992]PHM10502.1 hypothetical protein CK516_08140 [Nostoc sp. 'Peltigera malacea cyanobiont' DB3992]
MINLLALQRKRNDLANYKISPSASPVQELPKNSLLQFIHLLWNANLFNQFLITYLKQPKENTMNVAITSIGQQLFGWKSFRYFLKHNFETWFQVPNDDEIELEDFLKDQFDQGLFFNIPSSF